MFIVSRGHHKLALLSNYTGIIIMIFNVNDQLIAKGAYLEIDSYLAVICIDLFSITMNSNVVHSIFLWMIKLLLNKTTHGTNIYFIKRWHRIIFITMKIYEDIMMNNVLKITWRKFSCLNSICSKTLGMIVCLF